MRSRLPFSRGSVTLVLILQVIPLVLFPPEVFSPSSQKWWLPVLLVLMVVGADLPLLLRHSAEVWPWYLMSFAQGINIISRVLMMWPDATLGQAEGSPLDIPYLALTFLAVVLSLAMLWFAELPEARSSLLRD